MLPGAQTVSWNTYLLKSSYVSSFQVDNINDRLAESMKNDPHISFLGYSVGETDAGLFGSYLSAATFGLVEPTAKPASLRYKSDLSPAAAQELAARYLNQAKPGCFSNYLNVLEAVGAQVVAPTIVEAADTAKEAAKGVASTLPWIALGVIGVAVIYGVSVFKSWGKS